ncbi:MAG: hypothetical protein HYZ15_04945 [Sphingobacteriales bacterium]|nr:hypothetical protein [Sphingobacteriales bacterium]
MKIRKMGSAFKITGRFLRGRHNTKKIQCASRSKICLTSASMCSALFALISETGEHFGQLVETTHVDSGLTREQNWFSTRRRLLLCC